MDEQKLNKFVKLLTFNGDKEKFQLWLVRFEAYTTCCGFRAAVGGHLVLRLVKKLGISQEKWVKESSGSGFAKIIVVIVLLLALKAIIIDPFLLRNSINIRITTSQHLILILDNIRRDS